MSMLLKLTWPLDINNPNPSLYVRFCYQGVGNALYGMKNMSSEEQIVRDLLVALLPKIKLCADTGPKLRAIHCGNALYGLQTMCSRYKEVRAVVAQLAPMVEACEEQFRGQEIGNALYGMRYMNSTRPEVRALLSALAPKIRGSLPLNRQEIGNALYGLQSMRTEHREVRVVLSALAGKVRDSPDALFLGSQQRNNALCKFKCAFC
jgi:hypothetical protein